MHISMYIYIYMLYYVYIYIYIHIYVYIAPASSRGSAGPSRRARWSGSPLTVRFQK